MDSWKSMNRSPIRSTLPSDQGYDNSAREHDFRSIRSRQTFAIILGHQSIGVHNSFIWKSYLMHFLDKS